MRINGTISRFGHKGFGFIVGENGKEYFLHQNDIEQSIRLKQNDEVSFSPDENERGLIARKVQLIKSNQSDKRTSAAKRADHPKQKNNYQSILNGKLIAILLVVSIGINLYLVFGN